MTKIKTDKDVISDASRKLDTVYALLDELERVGDDVSIKLVRALLQATRTTLETTVKEAVSDGEAD